MKKEDVSDYEHVFSSEINLFLGKINARFKDRLIRMKTEDIRFINASGANTKQWEFTLNKIGQVRKGRVGVVTVSKKGMEIREIRKQRALLIAAEIFTYVQFAKAGQKLYDRAKSQNQYLDIAKKILGKRTATETRETAMRYIIEDIGEHKLANYSGNGWVMRINKVKRHDTEIANAIGSSEQTFSQLLKRQNLVYTTKMLQEEDILIRLEIEEMENTISLLRHAKGKHRKFTLAINRHIKRLEVMKKELARLLKRIDHHLDTKAKIREVYQYFEKEKINILRDLDILEF